MFQRKHTTNDWTSTWFHVWFKVWIDNPVVFFEFGQNGIDIFPTHQSFFGNSFDVDVIREAVLLMLLDNNGDTSFGVEAVSYARNVKSTIFVDF